jgi:hypothetical protein
MILSTSSSKLVAIFLLLTGYFQLKAQPHNTPPAGPHTPPIPVEVLAGNNQVNYQTTFKRSFSPTSKLGFFGLATYTADYSNELSKNNVLIEGQLSYTIKGGFGIMAGTFINSVIGFSPIAGPQYIVASREFLAVTIASFFLNGKKDVNLFGLYEYKPALSPKWTLYNRLQFIYNHNYQRAEHNRSYLYLRSGLRRNALTLGLGANLDQYGPQHKFGDNYGVFAQWEFK